jgi:hypothetical protein
VSYGNGSFMAVGAGGTVLISPDGINWTSQNPGTSSVLNAVCYGNGSFMAVGTGTLMAVGTGTFVAVGTGGAIIQSMVSGQSSPGQPTQHPSSNPIPITPGGQLIIFTIGQSSFFVNGQSYNMDASPFISNGRTLVPVRYLANALGAQTDWDAATRQVTITKGVATTELTIDSTAIITNGKTSQMDTAPLILNGRTYLPARDIAEALGYTVEWNAAGQTVNIVDSQ